MEIPRDAKTCTLWFSQSQLCQFALFLGNFGIPGYRCSAEQDIFRNCLNCVVLFCTGSKTQTPSVYGSKLLKFRARTRQTDRCNPTHYHAAFAHGKIMVICTCVCLPRWAHSTTHLWDVGPETIHDGLSETAHALWQTGNDSSIGCHVTRATCARNDGDAYR